MADKERYEILKLLGKGRTGGVYEAEDTVLNRKVALRRFFSESGVHDSSKLADDFTNIAQNLCNLQNPNLLTIFDAGVDDDGAFMVSQLMDGKNLAERIAQGSLEQWDAHDLASQMLDALYAAHSAGFIHGAITPGSIMMMNRARGGHLYVILDLGLCRLAPLIQGADSYLSMMADPALMAPELFEGKSATEKSDLYMLGQLIYVTLAGGHPFSGLSMEASATKHKSGDIPRITDYRPELDPQFAEWIHKMIDPDPDKRPESAQAAAEILPVVERPAPSSSTTRQQKLKLVTSAVPNKNTSRVKPATGPQENQALTDRVTVTSSTHNTSLPAAQASNKSVKIVMAIVAVAILLICGGIFLALQGGKKPTTAERLKQEEAANQPQTNPYATFSSSFQTDIMTTPPGELQELKDEDTRDWAVPTGIPVSDNFILRSTGGIINSLNVIGNVTPTSYPQPAQKFTLSNGKKLTPSVRLEAKTGGLATQEGWSIKMKAPKDLNGPLKISTFFTVWRCDAILKIKTSSGKYLDDEYSFSSNGNNVTSEVTANIYDLKPGETFYIEVTVTKFHPLASNPSYYNPGIAINAVKVLKD